MCAVANLYICVAQVATFVSHVVDSDYSKRQKNGKTGTRPALQATLPFTQAQ